MRSTVVAVMPLAVQMGGAELNFRQFAQRASANGIDLVVVFLECGPMVSEIEAMGLAAEVIDAGRLRHPAKYITAVAAIRNVIMRAGADGVISWMAKAHLYAGPAAALARVPAVWSQSGVPQTNEILSSVANKLPSKGVICCSHQAMQAQSALRPLRPIRVVYPGADLERFDPEHLASPAELRQELGLPAHGAVIGVFCRLQSSKGVEVLIDALALVRRANDSVHLVVVGGQHAGERGHLAELVGRVDAQGLSAHVSMVGHQTDVPRWMNATSVVCMPSDATESFGIAVVEAMSLGKPTIASLEGGPNEIITDGLDGLLVPFGDPVALAGAITAVISDERLGAALGEAARLRAAGFGADAFASNFTENLLELLDLA